MYQTLAFLILTAPVGTPVPGPQGWFLDDILLSAAMYDKAIEWRFLGSGCPRNAWFQRSRPDYVWDVQRAQEYFRDYGHLDLAVVASWKRIVEEIGREELGRRVTFSQRYVHGLRVRYETELDREPQIRQAIEEAEELGEIWRALGLIEGQRNLYYYGRLRNLLGDEAYLTLCLPPNVPTWRFVDLTK